MAVTDVSPALAALTPRQRRLRLGLVALIIAGLAGAFLAAGGWVSPRKLTPERLVDTFEQLNGVHPGFRRNHAKGVGVSGSFVSNGRGARLSKASVFQPGSFPVVGRFALGGGLPEAPDAAKAVRSFALQFSLPGGEQWRTGMNAIPVFPVRTPEAFREQLIAMAPEPATGKPNPARVAAFLQKYPETARALRRIQSQKPAGGSADSTFHSLNAFVVTDAGGRSTPVRWSLIPEPEASAELGAPALAPAVPNFLFDALIARVRRGPAKWHLILTVGTPADSTSDPTLEWPADRERIDAGILSIDRVESEATSPARTINFDPLVLPAGIAPSDDPILSARSAAYAVSFRRRAGEPVAPSAVTPAAVEQGGRP
jgi:catalase